MVHEHMVWNQAVEVSSLSSFVFKPMAPWGCEQVAVLRFLVCNMNKLPGCLSECWHVVCIGFDDEDDHVLVFILRILTKYGE